MANDRKSRPKPRFRQMKKHEAGYFLIALGLALLLLGFLFNQYQFFVIGAILAGTGIVFQFGKSPPDNPYQGESDP